MSSKAVAAIIVCVRINLLFFSGVTSVHQHDNCDLQSCFPKLTTNTSRLNALLILGIFEAPLYEKCLTFVNADSCFKEILNTCDGPDVHGRRKFHIESWQNAKKIFDYICGEEFIVFSEHQSCLRSMAYSPMIKSCDMLLLSKNGGQITCSLPSLVSSCVEKEARKLCPEENEEVILPKLMKLVDMFVSSMININTTGCPVPPKVSKSSKVDHDSDKETNKKESHRHRDLAKRRPLQSRQPSLQSATVSPAFNLFYTRKRYKSGFVTKRYQYNRDEDDDDDGDDDEHHDKDILDKGRYVNQPHHSNEYDIDDGGHNRDHPRQHRFEHHHRHHHHRPHHHHHPARPEEKDVRDKGPVRDNDFPHNKSHGDRADNDYGNDMEQPPDRYFFRPNLKQLISEQSRVTSSFKMVALMVALHRFLNG